MNDIEGVITEPQTLYTSLASLKEVHLQLFKRYRAEESDAVLEDVEAFLRKGAASGALLDSDQDRSDAQSLLDYWVTVLYRAERIPPDATLAEFDPAMAPELSDSLCPYVGLNPFQEGDKDKFFGRQRLLENMLNDLKEKRLLAVIGPSGSGKSSLVLAGLVPALKNGGLDGSSAWRYFPRLVPGSDPLKSLARVIKPADRDLDEWIEQQAALLRQDPGHLVKVIAKMGEAPAVFVLDQFEEVYTLCCDETTQQSFAENLASLVKTPDCAHRVILTMRTDFEQKIALLPALLPLFQEQGVKVGGADLLISAADLREAIEEPAKRIGLKFEDGVIDQLVKDFLGEAAGLPLLQFTLLRLWQAREHNRITWKAYRSLGSARQALTIAADEFYSGLIPQDQQTARRILLQLARPSAGVEITSNRVNREVLYQGGEARDQLDRVLIKLVDAGLLHLTKGDTPADDQIEVSHEALIRNWGTLVRWLEEERETLRKRFRLTEAAEQWRIHGKETEELLRGSMLEEAQRYEDLNPLEIEFVEASLAEAEAARLRELEADRSRLRADLEAKNARKEAENARKFRYISLGLSVAILMAIVAFFFGWWNLDAAKKATHQASDARDRADGIINFMVYDLRDKLRPVGQLQLMEDVDEQVLDYYDHLNDADQTETERYGKAVALQTRGVIESEAGRVGEALKAHTESLDIARALLKRAPADANNAQLVLAQCEGVAMAKWREADLQAAVALLDEALKAAKQAVPEKDPDPHLIATLAVCRDSFADAIKAQGKFDEALALYRESLEERKNLATREGATEDDKAPLFSSYIDLGDALAEVGDLSGALKYFQDGLAIAKDLKEAKPSDGDRLHNLSQAYDRVGAALQASGKLSEAVDAFTESNSLFKKLTDQDPDNADWQRNYSVTLLRLLDVKEMCEGYPDTENWFATVLRIRINLDTVDETDADVQDDLSEADASMSRHLLAHGDLNGALAYCELALELCSRTANKDSTNLDRQEKLADAHDELGALWRVRGAFERALADCNKSCEIRQKLAGLDPGNIVRQANLATSQEHLADAFKDQGDAVSARPAYERALAIRQALAAKDATNAQWQDDLAVVCRKLGQIFAAEKKFPEASEHFQTSVAILDKLVELAPTNAKWQAHFADAVTASAEAAWEQGDKQRASQLLRMGLKAREHLAALDASNTQRQAEYAHALYITATHIERTEPKSEAEAQQMLNKARDLMRNLEDKAEITREQQQWLAEINRGG